MDKHRHQEFIKFLGTIDANTPADLDLHLIVDNYGTHKHANVSAWLEQHPRFHLHFTPTSSSWLNMVERFFAEITRKRIRRGVFKSLTDLEVAIYKYLAEHNERPKPFVWTATTKDILAKVEKAREDPDMLPLKIMQEGISGGWSDNGDHGDPWLASRVAMVAASA
jgi:transposase